MPGSGLGVRPALIGRRMPAVQWSGGPAGKVRWGQQNMRKQNMRRIELPAGDFPAGRICFPEVNVF